MKSAREAAKIQISQNSLSDYRNDEIPIIADFRLKSIITRPNSVCVIKFIESPVLGQVVKIAIFHSVGNKTYLFPKRLTFHGPSGNTVVGACQRALIKRLKCQERQQKKR